MAPSAAAAPGPAPTALVLFLAPPGAGACQRCADAAALAQLRAVPRLSLGILSAAEGVYRAEQLLLDIGAGVRVEYGSYRPSRPPPLQLRRSGPGAVLAGWRAVVARASGAPQLIAPGALVQAIPGGAAYVSVPGQPPGDAIAAADAGGRISAWSDGPAATLPARVIALEAGHALLVADLPSGAVGAADLQRFARERPADQLLIAIERAPDRAAALLWMAAGGLAPTSSAAGELTSDTTHQRGLVASIDLPVTILRHLGRPIPSTMRGAPIRVEGALRASSLARLQARLLVLGARRLPTLAWFALACALFALAAAALGRAAAGARIAALAALWLPATVLLPAAFAPSAGAEVILIIAVSLALAALTDALLPWPRGPLLPALVACCALTIDALAGTQLLIRSILGPNPAFGARFYGIGNELKSALAVLTFGGVAAALSRPSVPRCRAAATMATAGTLLALIEGTARIGAGVGGLLLVCAGTAVAVLWLLPGRVGRRRAVLAILAPLAGVVVLAGLDLTLGHGSGHFTGSVLHARSAGDLRDLIVRRYTDAWDASKDGWMPPADVLALAAIAAGLRWRRRLLAPLTARSRGWAELWSAALAGGLAAGVVGALVEDSGTLLLVVAVVALVALLTYVKGAPALTEVRPAAIVPAPPVAEARTTTPTPS